MLNNLSFQSLFLFIFALSACSLGQNSKDNLNVNEFYQLINNTPQAQIIDVRTPDEFNGGHLEHALNFDWNGSHFDEQLKSMDKNKPVFVYCLSGGRSSSAAKHMRDNGFQKVYEMNGGMMKWRAGNLPETKNAAGIENDGMSVDEYNKLINSHQKVLIDFYATWCEPCKKMKPYLDQMTIDMKDQLNVIRIDADQNKGLLRQLQIDGLPVLLYYVNGQKIWRHDGFIEKADVLKKIK